MHTSIANETIQRRRDFSISGDSCHDFVPLYLARRNPMLWAIGDRPRAYIRIRLEVADTNDVIFADGNASSDRTGFVRGDYGAQRLPWDVVLASRWTGAQYPDGTRQRCSEYLCQIRSRAISFLTFVVISQNQLCSHMNKSHCSATTLHSLARTLFPVSADDNCPSRTKRLRIPRPHYR
jgi:hypothetical protein